MVVFNVLLGGLMRGNAPEQKLEAMPHLSPENKANIKKNMLAAEQLKQMAQENGISVAQLAIAWVLAQGEDIIALVGSRKVAQM